MLYAYVNRPIPEPNWVGSERLKYLWYQENMPDLSEIKVSVESQAYFPHV